MEKLVYLLMGSQAPLDAELAEVLRSRTVAALRETGATGVQVNLTDPRLGPPFGMAPREDVERILAGVSVWVDTAFGSSAGGCLPAPPAGAAWHGWLVCESEPIVNRLHPPGPDGRVGGFAQLVGLRRPASMTWPEWREAWQGQHTQVAIDTQSTFRYVQNVVVRPVTDGAPDLAAVVEECFPIEATSDMHVFFDSVGDDDRLARHMAAMSESCNRFMEGTAPVAWTFEWVF
jgi:hypothetical protein